MTTSTILLLVFAVLVSLVASYYQYLYKAKNKSNVIYLLAFMRFIALSLIGLVLINPTIKTATYEIIKPFLPLVIDNSASIKEIGESDRVTEIISVFKENKEIQEQFEVQYFQFSDQIQAKDSVLTFKGKQTHIHKVGAYFETYKKENTFPLVLLSDGNQTSGNDYPTSFSRKVNVYPLVLGDTTQQIDVAISQLNVNAYALQKNKFPVEIFMQYNGKQTVSTELTIDNKGKVVYKEPIAFSAKQSSIVKTVLLSADVVGLQVYTTKVKPIKTEKNTYNNQKKFVVDVINQKTKIALVTSIQHPDVGMLKRAIEMNELRSVDVVTPNDLVSKQIAYDIYLYYQPTVAFKALFDTHKKQRANRWIITGLHTDYSFLQQQCPDFEFRTSNQKEDYRPVFESDFSLFSFDPLRFETLLPLENSFVKILPKTKQNTVLRSSIRNIPTDMPLLTFSENEGMRSAYLFGENIWKWRVQEYKETADFKKTDQFIDKIIQYLATSNQKESLQVTHDKMYLSSNPIRISAQFFDKNYEFDTKAQLSIRLFNTDKKGYKQYEMLRSSNAYTVVFDDVEEGTYTFQVIEKQTKKSYTGTFEVLDYDMEKHFISPNINDLNRLALSTEGKAYYRDQVNALIKDLLSNKKYKSVQQSVVKTSALIDLKKVLLAIVGLFAIEWFIRKYKGLL